VQSPLLNGTLPPEIRTKIFDYALEVYISSEYPINTPYTRPNNTGKLAVTTALLQTCRLVYLETYHIPLLKMTHIFYHGSARGPNPTNYPEFHSFDHEIAYFSKLQPWQQPIVQKVHLYTQMFWLEHHQCFFELCKKPFMQSVRSLKISIRRGDWWYNESNEALRLNPFRSHSDYRIMTRDMNATKAEKLLGLFPEEHAWGNAFQHLQGLKELEIEFETSEDKKRELEDIITWAITWVFPAAGKLKVLQAKDKVNKWTWETPISYWSDLCPYCRRYNANCRNSTNTHQQREECSDRMRKMNEGVGPTCHVAVVKWKVVDSPKASRRREEYHRAN
jgi:hypothetical protein